MARFSIYYISNNSCTGTIKRGGKLLPAKGFSLYCPRVPTIPIAIGRKEVM
jgi:hypothetical protein